ncbi:MAG: N-acetylmuramoyl-L-alanine amidase [Terriglobales bacterium]
MSANPTRADWDATAADAASAMQEGNLVLESIARQEALRALRAFSDLRETIRNRRMVTGRASGRDLFETERFILDEVLQLICDRAQALTRADSIVIAFTEGAETVCRAAAGPLGVERGVHLIGESEFLQDCLDSGRILRCDDCAIDTRVELDFAHQMGARSTVMVPLRGQREQVGVLQALSLTPWAFTDHDIRCFDLFAELVLSALKPEDQDRRIHWLSDVASEVLRAKPAAVGVAGAASVVIPEIEPGNSAAAASDAITSIAETEPAAVLAELAVVPAEVAPTASISAEIIPAEIIPADFVAVSAELHRSEPAVELAEDDAIDEGFEFHFGASQLIVPDESAQVLPFLQRISLASSSRPGLSVVIGLVAVAALFSAGAWWGMRVHENATIAGAANSQVARIKSVSGEASSPQPVTAPPAPPTNVLAPAASDNLMSAASVTSDSVTLTPVPEDKLAALPKITGVRHWSSSIGSTVVIDMQDSVPYEVHRLMSPERIYFDLHDTVLAPELEGKTIDVDDAALSRVRIAQPVAGITRIVLDTKDDSNFSVSMESNPYRLVVELRGTDRTLTASNAPANPFDRNHGVPGHGIAGQTSSSQMPTGGMLAPAKAADAAALAAKAVEQPVPARTGKFRIVLDAGHGGWDLGTVGRQGLLEKNLVLDVTKRLGKLLQGRLGADVVFTRTGDTYLPLDQRADIANQAQADLFVSVHANYSSAATARGVETYYTNLFSAPGSKEIEKHTDGTFAQLTPVSLSAGGLHEKIEESRRLATSVQRSLYATLAASSPDIRNRGIKDAAFAVLTGTVMPAILTEISFVSSPADEHNLESEAYRQKIAEALYQGIARYEQASPHAKVAQLQVGRR